MSDKKKPTSPPKAATSSPSKKSRKSPPRKTPATTPPRTAHASSSESANQHKTPPRTPPRGSASANLSPRSPMSRTIDGVSKLLSSPSRRGSGSLNLKGSASPKLKGSASPKLKGSASPKQKGSDSPTKKSPAKRAAAQSSPRKKSEEAARLKEAEEAAIREQASLVYFNDYRKRWEKADPEFIKKCDALPQLKGIGFMRDHAALQLDRRSAPQAERDAYEEHLDAMPGERTVKRKAWLIERGAAGAPPPHAPAKPDKSPPRRSRSPSKTATSRRGSRSPTKKVNFTNTPDRDVRPKTTDAKSPKKN